ncbi:MAG: hypothetical protein QG578_468 [Thermodesulfobacteriota bacterium]|nr:hypothetical protein [Thermodesulfobacteriota bacterium]
MKLPENTLIAQEKLTKYLLVLRKRNNKSNWLAEAGYILDNWKLLESDLREQILTIDAVPTEKTDYGQMYEIRGKMVGPNGNILSVCTIWMTEKATDKTKFITMYPNKKE